jgi:hypothetical protein
MVTTIDDVYIPCWLYHSGDSKDAKQFNTREEAELAMLEGWEDSPAKFADNKAKALPGYGDMTTEELFDIIYKKYKRKFSKQTKRETLLRYLIDKEK